jgi:hypothetical protein
MRVGFRERCGSATPFVEIIVREFSHSKQESDIPKPLGVATEDMLGSRIFTQDHVV